MNTKYSLKKRKILCAFLIAVLVMALFVPGISAKRKDERAHESDTYTQEDLEELTPKEIKKIVEEWELDVPKKAKKSALIKLILDAQARYHYTEESLSELKKSDLQEILDYLGTKYPKKAKEGELIELILTAKEGVTKSRKEHKKHPDISSKNNPPKNRLTKNNSTKNNSTKNNSKPNTSFLPSDPLTDFPLNSSKPLQNITGESPGNTDPTVDYIRAWGYPGARLDPDGVIATGDSVRMYVEVSDAETASDSLTVDISYMPQGGSWTTVAATYLNSKDYWYVDWRARAQCVEVTIPWVPITTGLVMKLILSQRMCQIYIAGKGARANSDVCMKKV